MLAAVLHLPFLLVLTPQLERRRRPLLAELSLAWTRSGTWLLECLHIQRDRRLPRWASSSCRHVLLESATSITLVEGVCKLLLPQLTKVDGIVMTRRCTCTRSWQWSVGVRNPLSERLCQICLLVHLFLDHRDDLPRDGVLLVLCRLLLHLFLDVHDPVSDEVLSLLLNPLRHLHGQPERVALCLSLGSLPSSYRVPFSLGCSRIRGRPRSQTSSRLLLIYLVVHLFV